MNCLENLHIDYLLSQRRIKTLLWQRACEDVNLERQYELVCEIQEIDKAIKHKEEILKIT